MKNTIKHSQQSFLKVKELLSKKITLKEISNLSGVGVKTIRKWRDHSSFISFEENENKLIEDWKNNKISGSTKNKLSQFVIRYIWKKYNSKCAKCKWCTINPITQKTHLEIDHIDGNRKNNIEQNLILLCGNCHSLTPTFRHLNNTNNRSLEEIEKLKAEALDLISFGATVYKASIKLNIDINLLNEHLIGNHIETTQKYNNLITKWKLDKYGGGGSGQKGGINFKIHPWIRYYLINESNNKCSICKWSEVNPISKKIKLEIDHINGNKQDHSINNLRVLCYNCHSLTPTFQSLNK